MRTDRFCLVAAAAVAAQILWLNSLAGPSVLVFNFLAYASLTLLLWIATRGRRPLAVPGGVILLGALAVNPAGALNPWVAAAASLLTAGTLFFLQGKPVCAESSPR